MKRKLIMSLVLAIGALAGAVYGAYTIGMKRGMEMSGAAPATASTKAGEIDPATGKKVLYWHDPMVPGRRFDKPGKSPFMDMMLVPVYADGDGDQSQVTVSPRVQQNLGVRTAEVTLGSVTPRVEAAGSIAFNERDQVVVQARATGYIERLHVRATLDRVRKGQPLADLYVPDWVAAQDEFLSVRRMKGTDLSVLVDGARRRMRQVGMSEELIRLVEASDQVQPRFTLVTPMDGVIVELMAREGMTVMPGATLFRINGLRTVWANAEVPESQTGSLRPGSPVEARSPALPGSVFRGTVQTLLPDINQNTRTRKARVELANPDAALAPGMFVSVALSPNAAPRAESHPMVPTEAIIQTGRRTVVMLAEADGRFRPVEVEIGMEANGQTEIKRGVVAGQKVVVSGQFLVDSEASLRATSTRMGDMAAGAPVASIEHSSEGKVEAVRKDTVTLSHGPIPSLQWGAMTMDFGAPASGLPAALQPGQSVRFAFTMNKDGMPVLTRIEPTPTTPQPPADRAVAEKER